MIGLAMLLLVPALLGFAIGVDVNKWAEKREARRRACQRCGCHALPTARTFKEMP